MLKICHVLLVVALITLQCSDCRVTDVECRQLPTKNKHCHLETGTWERVSDQVVRYVFDWNTQKCLVWHWWTDSSRCSIPVDENNFATERECMNACTGWAK